MAVSVTVTELAGAIRAGSTALETAEITRIREYAIEAIGRHLGASYDDAPETVLNEATIRLTGYIYDKPTSARGAAWANAGRNSGAWSTLLPYVIHRAGGTAEATAAAQAAMGSADNPVIEVTVDAGAGTITVSFADGTTRTDTLPAGMGGSGTDQTARDAAAAAQGTADSAESRSESNAAKADATVGRVPGRGWSSALSGRVWLRDQPPERTPMTADEPAVEDRQMIDHSGTGSAGTVELRSGRPRTTAHRGMGMTEHLQAQVSRLCDGDRRQGEGLPGAADR